jgi:MarR family transcriptional regulator, organic hydroperoxide resistance regulator
MEENSMEVIIIEVRPMSDVRHMFLELGLASARLSSAVDSCLRRELGLPLVLFQPMSVIAGRRDCRVHDLAEELAISSGGASKLTDRLEARGYCRRLPNPGDRRSAVLELTPAGASHLAAGEHVVEAELQRMLGQRLSAAEVTRLIAVLRELRTAILDA